MKHYGFFRSSAAFRLRIALNLKGLAAEHVLVNFAKQEQLGADYKSVNPQARVPSLALDDGTVLIQSLAIIEYLEETHPNPPLLPKDAKGRARVRGLANLIACDIHPLNNISVLNYLRDHLKADEASRNAWYRHWVAQGFTAFEALLKDSSDTGNFCHGGAPGLADVCLVPQVFNAQRYECPLGGYPTLMRVFEACMKLAAFDKAQPMKQPEAAFIK
jgi:maleylacetoacetate isomerase